MLVITPMYLLAALAAIGKDFALAALSTGWLGAYKAGVGLFFIGVTHIELRSMYTAEKILREKKKEKKGKKEWFC